MNTTASPADQPVAARTLEVGDIAPPFRLVTAGGEKIDPGADHISGKVLVLLFMPSGVAPPAGLTALAEQARGMGGRCFLIAAAAQGRAGGLRAAGRPGRQGRRPLRHAGRAADRRRRSQSARGRHRPGGRRGRGGAGAHRRAAPRPRQPPADPDRARRAVPRRLSAAHQRLRYAGSHLSGVRARRTAAGNR